MVEIEDIELVYDGECPACDFYCRRIRIDETAGELRLIDARNDSKVVQEITDAGLDIDQGMVLKVGNNLYYGSDAINALALISTKSGWFNRLSYYCFRSQRVSKILYPVLRACRNLLLKILGKKKINNLQVEDNDRF